MFLNRLLINFGLIVINVRIHLIVVQVMLVIIIGVHTVLIKNYVKMKNVKIVLINHLHLKLKVNFGVIKTNYYLDKYINVVLKKIFFICNKCFNEFDCSLANVINNSWCPYCINKSEGKLFYWLKKQTYLVKPQVIFNWCKKQKKLPFDFLLKDFNIIIELDGPQHFKQVSNWKSPEYNKENDEFKNKLALENGYKMIRISQEIVLADKEDWENKLKEAINKCN